MAFSIQLKMALFARLIIGPFHPTLTILKDAIEYQLMYVENNESNRAIYLS